MRAIGIALGCLVLALVASLVRADIIAGDIASLYTVVGNGILSRTNVASVANPSTGVYRVTLGSGCRNVAPYGKAHVEIDRADGHCFGKFTSGTTIDVTCRTAAVVGATPANSLVNIPNGTEVVMTASCARP